MINRTIGCLVLAFALPAAASGQEAYLQQISAGPVSVSLTAQFGTPDIAALTGSLNLPLSNFNATMPDTSRYPVIDAAVGQAVARTSTIGNGNTALIIQNDIHAASITQFGNSNTAQIAQSGFNNRASVYQLSSNNIATISQSGSNNVALTLQR